MSRPTYIKQPGPVAQTRFIAAATRGGPLTLTLEPGQRLIDTVASGFGDFGFESGTVDISGVALGPFAYVMPALSKTGEQAAFYSETFRPSGITRVRHGAMTFGVTYDVPPGLGDEGLAWSPFFHTHALWTEADGRVSGGHVLPDETIVAERIIVPAFGIADAWFERAHDPETNFKLFGPVAVRSTAFGYGRARGHAIRLRPNQDLTGAIEEFCWTHKMKHARIHGGVGSTIGAAFDDGRVVNNFATEVYIQRGIIEPDANGQPVAQIDVGLVDFTGATAQGRLARGQNPVLMTFELIIEAGA
jgi:predicted DNA-binding protein with PD1-like motif